MVIKKFSEEFEEEEWIVCDHCGCEEHIEEMREGMCPDCYEDWIEDCRESEEE